MDSEGELASLAATGVLAHWEPAGREVRTGTWAELGTSTVALVRAALGAGRQDDAARLGRYLVVEAEEIHELYSEWSAALPRLLARRGHAEGALEHELSLQATAYQQPEPEREWEQFAAAVEAFAGACERGAATLAELECAVDLWRRAHDRHRDLVAAWIDVAAALLGEEHLGEVWRELQAEGIRSYARYSPRRTPWPDSFAYAVQAAIEGMHAHLGGRSGEGEVVVREHADRVELEFDPCGSGGRLRAERRFGVTEERFDWAWNEVGVCRYCVHCCVLMQLEPIDRLGFPVRVVDPPLRPGDSCRWTVYRDPERVPEAAFRRVGRSPEAVR